MMVNKSLPFWMPQIGMEEYALVTQVLDSNFLNDGEVYSNRQQDELPWRSESLG
jgi:hypothetical protein